VDKDVLLLLVVDQLHVDLLVALNQSLGLLYVALLYFCEVDAVFLLHHAFVINLEALVSALLLP
jgi:hypothetical protein